MKLASVVRSRRTGLTPEQNSRIDAFLAPFHPLSGVEADRYGHDASYLIDYPCKQNPYANAVAWNQKFYAPTIAGGAASATGNFYTTTGGTNYCLTSPLTNAGLVVVKPCSGATAGQSWTVYNNDDSLTYTMKYTIVDSSGLCLSLASLAAANPWSVIDVERCVGRRDQKWNADPTTPGIVDVQEK